MKQLGPIVVGIIVVTALGAALTYKFLRPGDPARPANVPADAKLGGGPDERTWWKCSQSSEALTFQCEHYSELGELLGKGQYIAEGPIVPFEIESSPPNIMAYPEHTKGEYVLLRPNGLIETSEGQKTFVNGEEQETSHP